MEKENCALIQIEKLVTSVKHRKMRGEQKENPHEGLKVTTKLSEREDLIEVLKKKEPGDKVAIELMRDKKKLCENT